MAPWALAEGSIARPVSENHQGGTMPIILTEQEKKSLAGIEKSNRSLFYCGIGLLALALVLWSLAAIFPVRINQWISGAWPNSNSTISRLEQIVPQTAMEKNLLANLEEVIPLGPLMVKIMAAGSAVAFVFCLGLLAVGFSVKQRKMIKFFRDLISKK